MREVKDLHAGEITDHVYVVQLEDLNLGTPLAGNPDLQVQC